jgi:hypothetical protein
MQQSFQGLHLYQIFREMVLSDVGQMLQELEQIAQIVKQRLEQHETRGRTLTLSAIRSV